MLESAGGTAVLVCAGLCLLTVIAIVVLASVGGSAAALLPFGTLLWVRLFRREPRSTATSYSLDQGREAGGDDTAPPPPPSQELPQ